MATKISKTSNPEAPFAFEGLDRVIHERARLGILSSLMTHTGGLSFGELKRLCNLTDGNLARHLQMLEEDGIVRLSKEESGGGRAQTSGRTQTSGRAQTVVRVTASGRKRYLDYLTVLEQIVKDAAAAGKKSTITQRSKLSPIRT